MEWEAKDCWVKQSEEHIQLVNNNQELQMEWEIEQMWDKFKKVVSSAEHVWSCKVGRRMRNTEWRNDEVARAVEGKIGIFADVASYKWAGVGRTAHMTVYRDAKKEVKSLVGQRKGKLNEFFSRKMNKDAIGNRNLFLKKVKNEKN